MYDHEGDISSIESISAPGVEPNKMSGFLRNLTNEVKRELQNGALRKQKKTEEELLELLLKGPIEVGSPLLPIKLELSMEDLRENVDLHNRWVLSGQPVYEES